MTTADVIQTMTERIVRDFHPLRLSLFGSHARGDARPESDIDLLVRCLRQAKLDEPPGITYRFTYSRHG